MSNELVGKVPLGLVKFILKRIIRRQHFKYNTVNPPDSWESIGAVTAITEEDEHTLMKLDHGSMRLSFLSPDVAKIQIAQDLTLIPESWVVEDEKFINHISSTHKDLVTIEPKSDENGLVITISKETGNLTISTKDGTVLFSDIRSCATSGEWLMTEKQAGAKDEHYYGFGENTGSLDKRNQIISFWNTDSLPYDNKRQNLYQSQPVQIVVRENGFCFALVYDNPHKSQVHIQKKDELYHYSYFVAGGGINYYVILGDNTNDLFHKLANLLGKAPLPPLSTLGYHQCKWSYYPESEVRDVATKFREKQIPCDFIHLDIDYLDGYRVFTWDKTRFPDPKKLADDLSDQGFKLMTMTDPGVKVDPGYPIYEEGVKGNHFIKNPDGSLFVGEVWPGECHFPDFTQQSTREWFGGHFKVLTDVGVKGFWIDMNDPSIFSAIGTAPDDVIHPHDGKPLKHAEVHNVYGHLMAKASYEGLQKLLPNERIFVLTRSAYLGTQRYSGSWTGDNNAEWSHLRMSLPMLMNMACSGQVMIGPDIGGFAGKPSAELLIRWYQAGLFYPFFRSHSINSTCAHEPWKYSRRVERIIRETIQLRYHLLLHIYDEIRKACGTGVPAFRPVWVDYPEDPMVHKKEWADTQYLFGSSLLVAPILKRYHRKRKVYLPKGTWYKFDTGEEYEGGKEYTLKCGIESVLIFTKPCVIKYVDNRIQWADHDFRQDTQDGGTNKPIDITLRIYGKTEATGAIYLDDGYSLDYQNGDYELVNIDAKLKGKNTWYLNISRKGKKNKYVPKIAKVVHMGSEHTNYLIFEK